MCVCMCVREKERVKVDLVRMEQKREVHGATASKSGSRPKIYEMRRMELVGADLELPTRARNVEAKICIFSSVISVISITSNSAMTRGVLNQSKMPLLITIGRKMCK